MLSSRAQAGASPAGGEYNYSGIATTNSYCSYGDYNSFLRVQDWTFCQDVAAVISAMLTNSPFTIDDLAVSAPTADEQHAAEAYLRIHAEDF